MADSYRPPNRDRDRDRDRNQRNARPSRPLADRMTFTGNDQGLPYDNYRPDNTQPQQRTAAGSEFTFTSGQPGPRFAPAGPSNPNPRPSRRQRGGRGGAAAGAGANQRNANKMPPQGPRNMQNGRGRGGGFRPKAAHDRPILLAQEDAASERTLGVIEGSNKFRNLEDISDDENADKEEDKANKKVLRGIAADGDSVPKWSNPDPYTVAPPPSETTGKKTDVVALIRKAKNEAAEKAAASNAVSANHDFISFDLDDMEENREEPAPPVQGSLNDLAAPGKIPLPKKPQAAPKAPKRKHDAVDRGGLVSEWLPGTHTDTSPWTLGVSYDSVKDNLYKRLHNEIMDFYDYVKPTDFEESVRMRLISRVQDILGNRVYRGVNAPCRVLCFGSFPAGLYLPTADMDLVYASRRLIDGDQPAIDMNSQKTINATLRGAARKLQDRLPASNVNVITRAKVPIIKLVDNVTGINVDISFENISGIAAQTTFKMWKQQYTLTAEMVSLVKQFLVMRGLNEVHHGGLGGFTVICLVVHFLHLQERDKPGANLGETFLDFLDYYGNEFDLAKDRIVMNPPSVKRKTAVGIDGRPEKPDGLSIQDPNRPDNNISGGSHKAHVVFEAFRKAYQTLVDRMDALYAGQADHASILDAIIGGNYSSYEEHRNRINRLRRG